MLRIEYVCHSCLHIDTGDTTLVFDPWFKGTAYKGQWFLFPLPVRTDMLSSVANIIYSHGHDDHLHAESLEALPHHAHVFFPYQWKRGIRNYFHEHGFEKVTEAVTFKPYRISESTVVTYIGFSLESVIVVESNGKVMVNLNDALNSHHENIVKIFLREIKKRWPVIDYLFSGWSGAGYFPNTVHYPGKDDVETGKLREQYFANNFCRFVQQLEPVRAMAYAPGFALLADDKRWINDVKFPRALVAKYYRENFDADTRVEFINMNPGDYFEDEKFYAVSPYNIQLRKDSLYHLIDALYPGEAAAFNQIKLISEERTAALAGQMEKCLNDNRRLYDAEVLRDVSFAVVVTDAATDHIFNIDFENEKFVVARSDTMAAERKLILRTHAHLLEHALAREWGADAMTIGYGLDIDVFEELTLEKNLDIVCVRLLSRYPRATDYLAKQPVRTLAWLLTNPMMAKLAVKQKFVLKSAVNKYPFNERDHWISYSKCDLCQVCNMPLLSNSFAEQLE